MINIMHWPFVFLLLTCWQGIFSQEISLKNRLSPAAALSMIDGRLDTYWVPDWQKEGGDAPREARIQLQGPHWLERLEWYDYEGVGTFEVVVDGKSITQAPSSMYNSWRSFTLGLTGTTIELRQQGNGCRVSEIRLIGRPLEAGSSRQVAQQHTPYLYYNNFDHLPNGPYPFEQFRSDWHSPSWQTGITEKRAIIEGGSLKVRHLPGSFGSSAANGGVQWPLAFSQGYDSLWLQYRFRFGEKEFEWVKGGKLPGLYGGQRPGGGVVSGGYVPNGRDGFSARLMWQQAGRLMLYLYHLGQKGRYGDNMPLRHADGRQFAARPGRWYTLTQQIVLNRADRSTDIIRIWIDEELVLEHTGLLLRKTDSIHIDGLYFSNFYGGNDSSWAPASENAVYFDEVKIHRQAFSARYGSGSCTPFDQFIGTNVVLDNDLQKIRRFKNLRLYLHTEDISTAENDTQLFLSPILGFERAYDLPAYLKALQEQGIRVMLTLKNNPPFLPGPDGPSAEGDPLQPQSYARHAAFVQRVAAALGDYVAYIGCGNEWYEHWKPGGNWPPEAVGAFGIAVDRATRDRRVKIGPAGDVAWDRQQTDRLYRYLKQHYKGKFPFDYYQIHLYYNQSHVESNDYTKGIDFSRGPRHPEWGPGLRAFVQEAVDYIHGYWPGLPVVIGEMGYDIGYPPDGDDESPNRATSVGRTSERTQADWLVRSYLCYAATEVEVVYQYMFDHVNEGGGGWLFGSSGLVDANNSLNMTSWYFSMQVMDILRHACFDAVLQENDKLWIYRFQRPGAYIYALWSPTVDNSSFEYELAIEGHSPLLMELVEEQEMPKTTRLQPQNGKVRLNISETPSFVVVKTGPARD